MTAEPGRPRPNGAAPLWAYPFAQLFAGVPRDQVRAAGPFDAQPDHLRPILAAMLDAATEQPLDAWQRLMAGHADAAELMATIRRVELRPSVGQADAADARPFRLLTVDDLANRPPLRWQVAGHLPAGTLSVLFGPSGGGKSFVAQDLALAVAAGVDFLGALTVEQGGVVYVAAEGSAGLMRRIAAWLAAHPGADLSAARFLDRPVNLLSGTETAGFLDELGRLPQPPSLVIFDTLARCMVGGDENSSRDMGLAIAHADLVRARTGAHVQLVHHMGKSGEDERGSSALLAAADTRIKLTGEDGILKLECVKQKDAEPFQRWHLRLVQTADRDSCTVEILDTAPRSDGPSPRDLEVLDILESHFSQSGASATEWQAVALELKVPKRTFYRAKDKLTKAGYVVVDGRRWRPTDAGRGLVPVPSRCHGGAMAPPSGAAELVPLVPHPFRGGTSGTNADGPPESGAAGTPGPGLRGRKETPELLPWQGGDDGEGAL